VITSPLIPFHPWCAGRERRLGAVKVGVGARHGRAQTIISL
jgi:hypothetical protein